MSTRVVLSFVLAMAFALHSSADTLTGKIVGYGNGTVNNKKTIVFRLAGQSAAGCNVTTRFIMTSDSLHFDGTVATIIAAFHAGTEITVYYTPTCSDLGNSYDVSYVCVGTIAC